MITLDDIKGSVCRTACNYPVRRAFLFGSRARGEAFADSDVDIVLDVEDGFSLFDLCGMMNDLERMLGVKVDIVMRSGLKDHVRRSAELDEVLLYAAA